MVVPLRLPIKARTITRKTKRSGDSNVGFDSCCISISLSAFSCSIFFMDSSKTSARGRGLEFPRVGWLPFSPLLLPMLESSESLRSTLDRLVESSLDVDDREQQFVEAAVWGVRASVWAVTGTTMPSLIALSLSGVTRSSTPTRLRSVSSSSLFRHDVRGLGRTL